MPRHRVSTLSLLCLALGLAAASAHAQWKWKDANGHVQYSDVPPPPGTPERNVLQRPTAAVARSTGGAASTPGGAASAASSGVDATLEAKRRKLEADEAARIAAQSKADADRRAAQQRDACQQARTQLRTLDDGMRIARINANGEREYLDDRARATETQHARDVIASDCK